jgi:NAD(P)-dependent dehydrogenase (short-subunit alcohol dehydrogenase family)
MFRSAQHNTKYHRVTFQLEEGKFMEYIQSLFSLQGQVAIVTGGTGVLGGAMARGLAHAGAQVGVLGRRRERAEQVVAEIEAAGGQALVLPADVLDKGQLEAARDAILERWGRIDILVNAAGGNVPAATLGGGKTFFDLPKDAFEQVFGLNVLGTVLPSQVFGAAMVQREGDQQNKPAQGCIVNISSMGALRVITRVVGYSAAKAAVDNFTRWLAVDLARTYGGGLRVNAIAPGFFVGDQNRALLLNEDGSLTARGEAIIDHTPAGRFGEPDELLSTLIWLCSPGASFVNGVVVPVDGGFAVYSGI